VVEWENARRGNPRRAHSQACEIDELVAGEVGFMVANNKTVSDTKIGDTITDDARPAIEPLPGFEELKPMVFAGLYTVDAHEHTPCVKRWKNCGSMILLSFLSRKAPLRWALVSVAAFWDCCTWKLFRSGWSASLAWS